MSKKVNIPDSQNDVITTMSHALLSFQDLVKEEMPGIPVVYTEELSFEAALKQLLSNNNYGGDQTPTMPFFAYNRTVLREVEDRALSKRAKNTTGCITINGETLTYDVAYGEFDIQFLYASNSVELTEKFEVVYTSDSGISGSKELTVSMAELGDFKYFLEYKELTEKPIEHDDMYYKGIIGSILMRGFYFTFRGKSGLIKEINQKIWSTSNVITKPDRELLGECTLPVLP